MDTKEFVRRVFERKRLTDPVKGVNMYFEGSGGFLLSRNSTFRSSSRVERDTFGLSGGVKPDRISIPNDACARALGAPAK